MKDAVMLLLRQLDRAENLRATALLDGIIFRGFEYHTDLSKAKHCSGSNGSISGYPVSITNVPFVESRSTTIQIPSRS